MRVLVVEKTSVEQAETARRLESLDRVDKDILDLTLGLANENNLFERLSEYDVLILGASLGEQSIALTERAKEQSSELEVLVLLSREVYSAGGIRNALARGARKVLCADALELDLVQELISIHEGFRAKGKVRQARVIAVVQAKGGVGVTTTCAALAEACATHGRSVLLWDLDIETKDLCRATALYGEQSRVMSELLAGQHELSRDNLRKAVVPMTEHVGVLPPPDRVAVSLDFVSSVEAIDTAQSIVALGRHMYDTIIIDIGSRFSPAASAIMQAADSVVLMVDDSILGISAARIFTPLVQSVVRNPGALHFLCSGISISKHELGYHVQQTEYERTAWELPCIPFDPAAAAWAGSGASLYSLGRKQTRAAFDELALALALVEQDESERTRSEREAHDGRSYARSVSVAGLALCLSYSLHIAWSSFANL
jgi:MinD-like ATPase involved in chromosome partitioning or flagellar assembly